jgi:hypothetical protein
MNQSQKRLDDDEGTDDDGTAVRGRGMVRLRQMRVDAQVQSADAQKFAARAAVRTARYMLWAVIIATISTVITATAVVYGIFANVAH